MSNVFCALTSAEVAGFVRRAEHRVALCVPAMTAEVADALSDSARRLGLDAVRVVMDCDEEVFRLGYGEIEALRKLHAAKIDVRQCPGLRAGLLVVDDRAWGFTPTALYVQPEARSDETPNAFVVDGEAVDRLVRALCPSAAPVEPGDDAAEPEIGHTPLATKAVERVEDALKTAPPIPFDVARQVRVFQPYIQYLDVHLTGCAIQRHRVTIPQSIQKLGAAEEIEDRLRTTFELIEKSSNLSSRALENELRKLLRDLSQPLGKPWGRVMLRAARKRLDERLAQFRAKVEEHKKKVETELAEHLARSLDMVMDYYLPRVKAHLPDGLMGQLLGPEPTDSQARKWLLRQLERAFPSTHQVISGMKLDVQYRDVTYETLNENEFADALKKAYPDVNWDKPFDEFNAAKEKAAK